MVLESVGLTDDSVKHTYDQFKKVLSKSVVTAGEKYKDIIRKAFKTLDLNENGFISFEEWTASHNVLGVDTKYARASFDVIRWMRTSTDKYRRTRWLISITNFTALLRMYWAVLSSMGPCNSEETNMMNNTNQFRWDS